jgi:F-type H+-transporting ATPase subunit b
MYLLAFAESIQLFPDASLFLHVGIILFMIWLLNRTLYKPINRVLETRERNKGGHSSEAEALLGQVGEKEARYTKEMLDARSQGYELIEKEQKKAVAARDKKLGEIKAEVAEMFDGGKAEIEKQSTDARKNLGAEAEKMADKITAGILKS